MASPVIIQIKINACRKFNIQTDVKLFKKFTTDSVRQVISKPNASRGTLRTRTVATEEEVFALMQQQPSISQRDITNSMGNPQGGVS